MQQQCTRGSVWCSALMHLLTQSSRTQKMERSLNRSDWVVHGNCCCCCCCWCCCSFAALLFVAWLRKLSWNCCCCCCRCSAAQHDQHATEVLPVLCYSHNFSSQYFLKVLPNYGHIAFYYQIHSGADDFRKNQVSNVESHKSSLKLIDTYCARMLQVLFTFDGFLQSPVTTVAEMFKHV